ncbi:MAG TPA: RHS repeat-associated core domain-containing protein, partial [Chitinophagales bacterium]|nr:RHS repeat-associated core domain-containing protein [Chitinophagales bacterium]
IQNYQTNFDLQTGNLLSRKDVNANLQEFFAYDANSRLLNNTVTGTTTSVAPFSITFATNGNINSKTDIGTYTYSTNKIHAVTGVQNTNQPISLRQQDISYSAFQQPTFITEPQASNAANVYALSYTYGADYQRVKALLTLNNSQQSIRYYLGSYEKNIIGTSTEWVHYVSAADGLAAIVTITGTAAPAYHYVFKDHLGSILRVTNATGTTEADQSFDAWGRRRNPSTWNYTNATAPTQTWLYRGYTAHEHLDQFALINMNGRLYDPTVGRMLSPDNYVQDALYAQTFNRYSYAHNNPLKYVDPDGNNPLIIVGAVIGGLVNLGMGILNGEVHDGWDALAYFGSGAVIGLLAGATGGAVTTALGVKGVVLSGAISGA